jgi:Ca-activated chloride channel family protein
MGMTFGNPRSALLFLLVAALFAISLFQILNQQRRLGRWIDRSLWTKVVPDFSRRVFVRKNALLALSLLFAGIALLRPQWGERSETIESKGMDILFLLDLSNSMLAEDTPPSRLDRARTLIKKTLEGLADDRVGVVGFAGKAFLTVPLTTDFGYVTEMTETLEPSMFASQGTEISKAIDTAIKAFERSAEDTKRSSRAFVLVTDGEDFGEGAAKAAARIKEFGGGFFAIAVGTKEGAPVPVRNAAGVLQTYKKDRDQKVVLSRVNRDLLTSIASEGGGSLIDLVNADDASYTLIKGLRGLARDSNGEQKQVIRIERFHYFLALSVFFLLLHLLVGYRKVRIGLPFLPLLLLIPFPSHAQSFRSYLDAKRAESLYGSKEYEESATLYDRAAKRDPDASAFRFNQATALAQSGKKEESLPLFEEVAKQSLSEGDYGTAARALYNEGVTRSGSGDAQNAFDRLTKSIELAKITGDRELEKKGREALARASKKQEQQQKQKQEEKHESSQEQKKDQKQKPESKPEKPESNPKQKDQKSGERPEDGKKRQFKSGTLSKDVAEGIMNDLSDREKQLHQHRLKEQKGREVENERDW